MPTLALTLLAAVPLHDTPITFERVLAPTAGLTRPVAGASIAGDSRLFIAELGGTVRVVRGGQVAPLPFLDVTPYIDAGPDTGLRAITFHPDVVNNGLVFVWYDAPNGVGGVDAVLARLTVDPSAPDRVDPASHIELLRTPQDVRGHGGGHLQFGPDGMLYAALGDGGISSDPLCRAQDPSNHMGSVLRLDVDSALPYAVPPDNPFVGLPAYAPELAHYGLRHPWKWSFDRATGALWIGDVGQWNWEEVDYVPPGVLGLNFGWNAVEGPQCFSSAPCAVVLPSCTSATLTGPVFQYPHQFGCSITGGYVYRGLAVPELFGHYICADFCTHNVFTLRESGGVIVEQVLRTLVVSPVGAALSNPVSFVEDGAGELFVLDFADGELYQLTRTCGVFMGCPGAPNSVGGGAALVGSGTTSLAANDLRLDVLLAPTATLGLLFYGPEVVRVPAGSGTRCVGPGTLGVFRAGVAAADINGRLAFALDLATPPFAGGLGQVTAGAVWQFQCWYRDQAPGGASTSNFSASVAVHFCP